MYPALMTTQSRFVGLASALAIIWLAIVTMPGLAAPSLPPQQATFRVAGYLPNYRMADFEFESAIGITDLILFSAEPNADGSVNLDRFREAPWQKIFKFKTEHRVRLILCIGGWERSKAFPKIATDPELRTTFARQVVEICRSYRLDGIDLDWEHPADDAEVHAYGALLSEIHNAFEPLGLQLSVTVAGWQRLSPEAIRAVDLVQVMAYDHPGRHSTFEHAIEDIRKISELGVEKSKMILGVPFYGRGVKDWNSVQTFAQLARRDNFDPTADEFDGYYFNGHATIAKKVFWARESGLGGIMIWELGQDAQSEQSLLRTILESSNRSSNASR